jgi:metal-responsive CopG/Arc/MetJ family transcriptional regulator
MEEDKMVKPNLEERELKVTIANSLYKLLMEKAQRLGFKTTSELLRHLIREYAIRNSSKEKGSKR